MPMPPTFRETVMGRLLFSAYLSLGVMVAASPVWAQAVAKAPVVVELLGDADYFPYSFVRNGELRGLYPEVIRRIDEALPEFVIVMKPVPWKRGLLMIERGEAAGLFPPYRHESERPYIRPYSEPLGIESVVIVCREDRVAANFAGRWPDDYIGMTVSTNLGFSMQPPPFWAAVEDGRVKRREFANNEANLLEMVAYGRVDCYINDRRAIEVSLAHLRKRLLGDVHARPFAPVRETLAVEDHTAHVGYSAVRYDSEPELRAFARRFDEALVALKAGSGYRALIEDYWASASAEPPADAPR